MPQGVRGKARKISDEIIIDSDDAADAVATGTVNNHGTKEPAQAAPDSDSAKNLQVQVATVALDVDLQPELTDDSDGLPAAVSTDKLQHASGQRGIKQKVSALVPRKKTSASMARAEGKYYVVGTFFLTSERIYSQ